MERFFFLISLTVMLSCGQKTLENQTKASSDSLKIIEVANQLDFSRTAPFVLSESASHIDIVPLELTNSSLVANIDKVVASKTNLFVSDNRNIGVLRFDRQGKFLNQIGRKGQGNGEFLNIIDFCVDDIQQEVYILSSHNGVLVYNLEGEYKRNYPKLILQDVFAQIQTGLAIHKKSIFLKQSGGIWYPNNFPKDSLWSLALVDRVLLPRKLFLNPAHRGFEQEIEKRPAPLSGWKNYWTEDEPNMDQYGGDLWLKYPDVDTIYQYEEKYEVFRPVYAIDLGEKKTKDYMASHLWIKSKEVFDNLYISSFYHSQKYIYLIGSQKDMIYTVCYNKLNGEIQISKRKEELFVKKFPGFSDTYKRMNREFILKNDFLGGCFTVNFTSANEWIYVIDQDVDIDSFIKSKNENVLCKEQQLMLLEKINGLLKEDLNPILLIAHIK